MKNYFTVSRETPNCKILYAVIMFFISYIFRFLYNLFMDKNAQKYVSRETLGVDDIATLFEKDAFFMSSFSLLRHRIYLNINISNTSFILFWLKQARKLGYLPLVIIESELDAESFYSDAISFFLAEAIGWIPLFDSSSSSLTGHSALENHLNRFVSKLYDNSLDLLISTEKVFKHPVIDKKTLAEKILHLRVGNEISFASLGDTLRGMGYQRSELVEYCGEFTFRGGIADVYPFGQTYPLRIEFFGDTIDSIRRFNPNDQNTFELCDRGSIPPASFSRYAKKEMLNVLPANTLVIRIPNPKKEETPAGYSSEIPFKQVLFDSRNIRSDISFPVTDFVQPGDVRNKNYYRELIDHFSRIVVFSEHDLVLEFLYDNFRQHADYVKANIHSGFQYKNLDLLLVSGREIFHKEHYVNPNRHFIPESSSRIDSPDSLRYGDAVVHVDYGLGIYRGIELLSFRGAKQEAIVVEYQNKDKVYVPVRYMNKIFHYSMDKGKPPALDRLGSARWENAKRSTKRYLRKAAFDMISLYRDRKKLSGFAFEKNTPDAFRLEADFPYDETRDQKIAIEDVQKDMERPLIMDRLLCGDVGFGKTEVAIRAAFKAAYSNKQVAVLVPTTMLCFQHYESFRERLEKFGIRVEYINRFVHGKTLSRRLKDLKMHRIDVLVGTHKLLSNILLFNDLGLLIIDEEHRFGVNDKEKIQNLKRHVDVLTLTATPIPRTLQMTLGGLRDITKIDTPPKERLPIATKIIYWNNDEIRSAVDRELERNGQVFILNNNINEMPSLQKKIASMFPSHEVRYAHGKLPGAELEKILLDFYHHKFDILISSTIIESGIDIPNANTLIVINAHRFGLSQLYQIRGRVGRSYKKAFAYLVVPRSKQLNPSAVKRLQTLEYYTDLGSGYQIAMRDLEIRGAGDLFGVEQSGYINRLGYAYFNRLLEEEFESVKSARPAEPESPDIQLGHPSYFPETYIENKDIRIAFYRELSEILSRTGDTESGMKIIERIYASCRDRFGPLPPAAENLFNDTRFSLSLKPYYIEKIYRKNNKLIISFSGEVSVKTIQDSAGSLLRYCNEHGIPIRFISKTRLLAEVNNNFLDVFYPGTFRYSPDSKPCN